MYINRSRGPVSSTRQGGFTLIELLVVIAIIGILSAVVLASLSTARSKGNDAAIESNLSTVQTQAEIYYGGTGGNSYGSNAALESGCSASDNMFNDTTIKNAIAGADNANGTGAVVCNVAAKGTAYAASATLSTSATAYWCVDSTGFSGQRVTVLGPAATVCPGS